MGFAPQHSGRPCRLRILIESMMPAVRNAAEFGEPPTPWSLPHEAVALRVIKGHQHSGGDLHGSTRIVEADLLVRGVRSAPLISHAGGGRGGGAHPGGVPRRGRGGGTPGHGWVCSLPPPPR